MRRQAAARSGPDGINRAPPNTHPPQTELQKKPKKTPRRGAELAAEHLLDTLTRASMEHRRHTTIRRHPPGENFRKNPIQNINNITL